MNLEEWKIKNNKYKSYAHFDKRISVIKAWEYISNTEAIKKHSFYPFIHYTKKFNKFNREKGLKDKSRELCYSAHIDRCIYQYYAYLLTNKYNARLEEDKTNASVIAYRNNLGKCNIDFANEVFRYIKSTSNCHVIVGDFSKFFDSLDHKYLRKMILNLLQLKTLPDDYYAIFKSITKFASWELISLLKLNSLKDTGKGIKELNRMETVLTLDDFKKYKKTNITRNPNNYGIPQGSAISAIFSNIYMMNFDKKIVEVTNKYNGMYRRYSDDFIIVIPEMEEDEFFLFFKLIKKIINSIPNLVIEDEKTQLFKYENNKLQKYDWEYNLSSNEGDNRLSYLGFTFDGEIITIRDKTISKYYYRMYRKLNRIVKNNGVTRYNNRINLSNLYNKYTYKGAKPKSRKNKIKNMKSGNFITYVKRAEKVFGKNEGINRSTNTHMQKIRRKLNEIK